MKYFKKEFVTYTDSKISSLVFGALPSVGRYFTKPCEKISDGLFKVEIEAPEGDLYYHFKFGESWSNVLLDPNNTQEGAKSWHSICRLGTQHMLPIEFNLSSSYIYKISKYDYEIKIISYHEWVSKVTLLIFDNKKNILSEEKFEVCYNYKGWKYLKLIINQDKLIGRRFCIKIYGKKSTYYYGNNKKMSKEISSFFSHDEIDLLYHGSQQSQIVYHIFPDSFNRSKSSIIDNKESNNFSSWGSIPDGKQLYGGNINGIREKLDYIKSLGTTCIYLTPVFNAKSNHRYDCISFTEIDPIIGTPYEFKEFVQACHQRGISVVLDIVLNHCGIDFWAFKDLLNNQDTSKYKDWFIVNDFPVVVKENNPNYSCWWGNGFMPQFNLDNPETKMYLFECCAKWIKESNIDGWRLDVAPELGFDFLREFKVYMKKIKDNILIIGENWKDSRNFLSGDQLNGITNYLLWWKGFQPYFISKSISLSEFVNNLMYSYFIYPHVRALENWTLISSHDIPRFSSMLVEARDIYKVVFIQVFFPGSPVVYYGDEIGIEGKDDPDNRRCMNWSQVNSHNEILNWYKKLLNVRAKEDIITKGHFKIIYVNDNNDILIFSRYLNREEIYFIINFSTVDIQIDLSDKLGESYYFDILNQVKNIKMFLASRNSSKRKIIF